MLEIKEIDVSKTYPIRHKVLRTNMKFETCKFITDDYEGTFHLGVYYNSKLVSIVSFSPEVNENFNLERQYRLRGMATLEEYRGLGFAKKLVEYSEQILINKNVHIIWCNARIKSVGFYEKLGFKTCGKVFEHGNIGKHILMFKEISLVAFEV